MLYGYDPVAYFSQNDAKKGDSAIKAEHMGVTWRFSSEANKAEFLKYPDKYMPQFGGFCSNGVNYAILGGGGRRPEQLAHLPRQAVRVRRPELARPFRDGHRANLQRAHQYWNEELAGSKPPLGTSQALRLPRAALQERPVRCKKSGRPSSQRRRCR